MTTIMGDGEPRDARVVMIEDEVVSLESRYEYEKGLLDVLIELRMCLTRLSRYPDDLTTICLGDEPVSPEELRSQTEELIERTDDRIRILIAEITLLKGMLEKISKR